MATITVTIYGCGTDSIVLKHFQNNYDLTTKKPEITILLNLIEDSRADNNFIGKIDSFPSFIKFKDLTLYDGRTLSSTITTFIGATVSEAGYNVIFKNDVISIDDTNKFDYWLAGNIENYYLFEKRGFVGQRHASNDIKLTIKVTNPQNGKSWSNKYTKHIDIRFKSAQEVANIALDSILADIKKDFVNRIYLVDIQ